jgi:hypothetical protein
MVRVGRFMWLSVLTVRAVVDDAKVNRDTASEWEGIVEVEP